MKYRVLEKLKAKTLQGDVQLSPGQIISLNPEKATRLIKEEKIMPLSEEKPYLKSDGTLIIPSGSASKYRWWDHGQTIADTLAELGVAVEVWERYTNAPYPEEIN